MDEKTVTSIIDDMKKEVTGFVTNTLEIAKLEITEKVAKSSAAIVFGFSLLMFSVIVVLFAFITLGLYLADVLGSYWQGFGISMLGTLLIVCCILLFKQSIKGALTNSTIRFLLRKEDEEVKYYTNKN